MEEAKPAETEVLFSKFDGGKIASCRGTLVEVLAEFVRVRYVDDEGNKLNVRFRRAPGATSGWGVGPAKHWRLADVERRKYCHPDLPARLR